MTVNEFLNELKHLKINENALEPIKKFLHEKNLDLERLAEYVLDNHKFDYFPTRAHLNEYWYKCQDYTDNKFKKIKEKSINTINELQEKREKWKAFSIKKILTMLHEIQKLRKQQKQLSLLELDFWSIYGLLYWEGLTVLRHKLDLEEKKRHLTYVKKCLEEDESFESLQQAISKNKFTNAEEVPFEKTIKFDKIF